MKNTLFLFLTMLAFSLTLKAQQFVSTAPSNRNAVLEEFTGRTCSYCPDGHVIANSIQANYPDRFWSVNIHSDGYNSLTSYPNLNTDKGNQIRAAFNAVSFPRGVINRSTPGAISRDVWDSYVETQMNQAAECNVGGKVMIDPETRVASILVEVYYTANSLVDENYLTVVMLQDSIIGSQSYAQVNPEQWMGGDQYCHMHILRDIVTDVMGDAISPTTQGTLVVRSYEYQIPETIGYPNGVAVDLNNIHFLAWVSERYQGLPTRPILNVCELETVFGVDEPIHPYVCDIVLNNTDDCSLSKVVDLKIRNIGTGAINSMAVAVEYGDDTYYSNWEGELVPDEKVQLSMPVTAHFGMLPMTVSITEANGQPYGHSTTTSVTCMEWANLEVEGSEATVELELMQDKYGEQITWEFTASDGTVLCSGGPYYNLVGSSGTLIHLEHIVLPVDECVKFTIYDAAGNGICCNSGQGYYVVKDSHDNVLFGDHDDGAFGAQASHRISVKAQQVGLEDEGHSLRIYPNPTTGILNVQGKGMTSVEVYNTAGQRMMSQAVGDNGIQLNMESLSNGIYFLRIHANDGAILNRTFSVARLEILDVTKKAASSKRLFSL